MHRPRRRLAVAEGFLGQSARGVCLRRGFGEGWLDAKLDQGKQFKLAVFPADSVSATMASWDVVEALLKASYPEVWPRLSTHFEAIRGMTIDEIEAQAGYDMHQVLGRMRWW